ncbi:MAG: hypothetical protein U5S82_00940 [Gammaproteobacteria bacterium]|nr:hypothetical protein [Gammaproteobacteria bacterium]
MRPNSYRSLAIVAILGSSAALNVAQADMFDMINPSRWFDNDRDYYRGPYGGGPYGYGPYGPGYGWGGHPGHYGNPYGGWGGYPGYGPGTIIVNPPSGQQQQQRLPE